MLTGRLFGLSRGASAVAGTEPVSDYEVERDIELFVLCFYFFAHFYEVLGASARSVILSLANRYLSGPCIWLLLYASHRSAHSVSESLGDPY